LSHNNSIKFFLDIQDDNIFFEEDCIEERKVKKVVSKIIKGTLTYKADICPVCGNKHTGTIIKYGTKTSLITINSISNFNAFLELKKQRFLCKECGSTFSADTKLIEKNCNISNAVKQAAILKYSKSISKKDIAEDFNISTTTLERIIKESQTVFKPNKNYLPEKLCFDEFKSVKECEGAMSFIFCDADNGKIIDIIEDRRLDNLKRYFNTFSTKARSNVKHIVIDMYSPYVTLIKEMFPQAKISIDRFHLVQLLQRAFNNTRIQLMKEIKNKNKPLYNKLKRYWKLFLKPEYELESIAKYHPLFRKHISQEKIIEYFLEQDSELKQAYEIYQDIYYALKKQNYDFFLTSLTPHTKISSPYIKTALNTLKKYSSYVKNSLKYKYSNGILEGINNKIKTIKRIGYGYRSFNNLKQRILICCNASQLKKILAV